MPILFLILQSVGDEMSDVNRKRGLQQDEYYPISKMARLGPRHQSPMQQKANLPSNSSCKASKDIIKGLDATLGVLNTPIPVPVKQPVLPIRNTMSCKTPNDGKKLPASFMYNSIEEYCKVEALRLLFFKNGLDYKRPREGNDPFHEENLGPYVAQWEDILDHWFGLIGSERRVKEAEDKTRDVVVYPIGHNKSGQSAWGHHNSKFDLLPPKLITDINSNLTKSTTAVSSLSTSQAGATKPPFQPTIARWAQTPCAEDVLYQVAQLDIRRQSDNASHQVRQSNDPSPIGYQPMRVSRPDSPSPSCTKNPPLDRRKSTVKLLLSSALLDDLVEVPEIVNL